MPDETFALPEIAAFRHNGYVEVYPDCLILKLYRADIEYLISINYVKVEHVLGRQPGDGDLITVRIPFSE